MSTKEQRRKWSKDWALKYPEKVKESKRKYRIKNKDKIETARFAYRKANRDKMDAAKRKWERENPEALSMQRARRRIRQMNSALDRSYRFHYDITLENFSEASEAQNHVCLICGENGHTDRVKRLVVDHDHNSGVLRGLLCHRCNCGIGYFKDDVERVKLAAKYPELFSGEPGGETWASRIKNVSEKLRQ